MLNRKWMQGAVCLPLTVLMLWMAAPVLADNFHYEIRPATRFMADEQGRLTALGMNWEYDKEVADVLLQGQDLSPDKRANTLQNLAQAMVRDLHELGYFTQLFVNGQAQPVQRVQEYGAQLSPDGKLQLSFRLPLQQPVEVRNKRMALTLADYDGAALIAYQGPRHIVMDDALVKHCKLPAITEEIVELPNDHSPTVQTVHIDCRQDQD